MIKEIVCRNLEKKEDAKKLVEDYNSRYSKVNHFGNSYSYNVTCVQEARDAYVKFAELELAFRAVILVRRFSNELRKTKIKDKCNHSGQSQRTIQ